MKKILSLLICLLFVATAVQAQTFSPDRPGIGNGSFITPENMLGVEAGTEFLTNDFVNQFSIGQLLLRYGLNENLELRANLGSFISQEITFAGSDFNSSGLQDMSLGAKYNFLSEDDKPSISALADLSLPVGDDAFSSGEVVPALGLLADHSFSDELAISSNLVYSFGVGNLDDSWLFTLTPGFSLNENTGAYVGYAGMYYGNGINQHWLEGGLAFGLDTGAQLDLNFGYETEGETFFIGFGFAQGF